MLDGVDAFVGADRVRAVLCVAGGWAGGNAASDGLFPCSCTAHDPPHSHGMSVLTPLSALCDPQT